MTTRNKKKKLRAALRNARRREERLKKAGQTTAGELLKLYREDDAKNTHTDRGAA